MRKPKRVAGLHGAGEAAAVLPETGVVASVSGAGVVVPGSSKRDLAQMILLMDDSDGKIVAG